MDEARIWEHCLFCKILIVLLFEEAKLPMKLAICTYPQYQLEEFISYTTAVLENPLFMKWSPCQTIVFFIVVEDGILPSSCWG